MKQFKPNDLFFHTIKTYPHSEFQIYLRKTYYNHRTTEAGINTASVGRSDPGKINLYEMNVDRPAGQLVYPFMSKDGTQDSFKTVTTSDYSSDFSYGDTVTGSYALEAGLSSDRFDTGQARPMITALQNTLNRNKRMSMHYAYTSSLGHKYNQELRLISIPSIFYGSSIKKGSVKCNFYVTGTLIATAQDIMQNGELIQTYGSNGTGSVAGCVLYKEGFMIMTGAVDLTAGETTQVYTPGAAAHGPRWIDYASTGSTGAGETLPNTVYTLEFKGVNPVPVLTMLCHADKGEFNHSNNPTYVSSGQGTKVQPITSSKEYVEPDDLVIKNIVATDYADPTGSFAKIVYIEKIVLYDKDKNIIGIAKLAKPVKKTENLGLTFKIKMDF